MVYQLKCYRLPESAPQALGKPMVNLLPIDKSEKIQTVMPMPSDKNSWSDLQIIFATKNGNIRGINYLILLILDKMGKLR